MYIYNFYYIQFLLIYIFKHLLKNTLKYTISSSSDTLIVTNVVMITYALVHAVICNEVRRQVARNADVTVIIIVQKNCKKTSNYPCRRLILSQASLLGSFGAFPTSSSGGRTLWVQNKRRCVRAQNENERLS